MANLKELLDQHNFNWHKGNIIYQETGDEETPDWANPNAAKILDHDDPILTKEFDNGFGGPMCPLIIAEDDVAIYFPSQYDGATSLEKVLKYPPVLRL